MRTEVYAVLNPDKMLRGQNPGAFFIFYLVIGPEASGLSCWSRSFGIKLLSSRNMFGAGIKLLNFILYASA